jgi:hypothetical protein
MRGSPRLASFIAAMNKRNIIATGGRFPQGRKPAMPKGEA